MSHDVSQYPRAIAGYKTSDDRIFECEDMASSHEAWLSLCTLAEAAPIPGAYHEREELAEWLIENATALTELFSQGPEKPSE